MLDATDEWYTNMDRGLINAILFIDLKKTLDTIDHDSITKRLTFSKIILLIVRNWQLLITYDLGFVK